MGEPENYDRKEFIYRVGTFFLLVGIGLFVFFMLSEAAKQPELNYFCGSMVFFIFGFMFRSRYKKAAVSSGRFSFLKRLLGRGGGSSGSGGRSRKAAKKKEKQEEPEEEYEDDEWEYE
ncbi:MAG TPA: hypothetical protein VLA72_01605 [Anaerolineales bacterium]|nr:hypothetical protein [Anaerolineales bacterium]